MRKPSPAAHAAGAGAAPLDGLLAGLRLAVGAGGSGGDGNGGGGDGAADLDRIEDWSAVLSLARRHGVAGLFHAGIRPHASRFEDAGLERRLEALGRRTVRRGMEQLRGLKLATDALAAAGIPCLVLKGLPLSRQLYGHPFVRDSLDIDLLVPAQAFHDAERVLCGHGWTRSKPDFPETPARRRWYERGRKEHVLQGPGGTLELHLRLFDNPRYFDAPFERLYAGRCTAAIGGVRFPAPGEDDRFVYLLAHAGYSQWHRLKWPCDVAGLLAGMTPERFREEAARCREAGLGIVLEATLRLCRDALGVGAPGEAEAEAAAQPAEAATRRRPAGRRRAALLARHARRAWPDDARIRAYNLPSGKAASLALKPGPGFVLSQAARLLFFAPGDWSAVDLPDRLFFLYFVLRPVLLLTGRPGRGRSARTRSTRGAHGGG